MKVLLIIAGKASRKESHKSVFLENGIRKGTILGVKSLKSLEFLYFGGLNGGLNIPF